MMSEPSETVRGLICADTLPIHILVSKGNIVLLHLGAKIPVTTLDCLTMVFARLYSESNIPSMSW